MIMAQWKTFAAVLLMGAGVAFADSRPTTKPAGGGALEVRAQTAFTRGEYALALPMLKQVAEQVKDKPDRLASIQEQIRVCEKQIAAAPPAPVVTLGAAPLV